jgi:hypothetical protein
MLRRILIRYESILFVLLVATPLVASSTWIHALASDQHLTLEKYAVLFTKNYAVTVPLAFLFVRLAKIILLKMKSLTSAAADR